MPRVEQIQCESSKVNQDVNPGIPTVNQHCASASTFEFLKQIAAAPSPGNLVSGIIQPRLKYSVLYITHSVPTLRSSITLCAQPCATFYYLVSVERSNSPRLTTWYSTSLTSNADAQTHMGVHRRTNVTRPCKGHAEATTTCSIMRKLRARTISTLTTPGHQELP